MTSYQTPRTFERSVQRTALLSVSQNYRRFKTISYIISELLEAEKRLTIIDYRQRYVDTIAIDS